jgi:3-oxoadipate enol-lactonase
MGTLVADAEAIIDQMDLRNVVVVGLSIGGLIAQGLATTRPETIRAIVLMDTAARIGTSEMWRDRINALHDDGIQGMSDAILDRWFAPHMRHDENAIAPWRHMLNRTPIDGYIGCCNAIAGADFTESTGKLSLPVMAIAGEADGSTPPDVVEQTAQLCGGTFHVIPDAGHLPCVEQPKRTGHLIAEFLKEVGHV